MLVLCRLSSSTTLFGSRDATLCTGRESTGHGLIVSHYSTPTPLRSALTLRLGDGRHGGSRNTVNETTLLATPHRKLVRYVRNVCGIVA